MARGSNNGNEGRGGSGGRGRGGNKPSGAGRGGQANNEDAVNQGRGGRGGNKPSGAGRGGQPQNGEPGNQSTGPGGRGGRSGRSGGRGEGGNSGRGNYDNNNNRNNNQNGSGRGQGRGPGNNDQGRGRGGRGPTNGVNFSFASSVQLNISSAGVSGEVLNFWRQLHKNLLKNAAPFTTASTDDCDMWKQCWAAAASGANGADFPAMSLLQVYVALPDAETIHPMALSVVQVLRMVLSGVKTNGQNAVSIKVVDTIVSIVKTRLQSTKSLSTVGAGGEILSACVKELKKSLAKCVMELLLQDSESAALFRLLTDINGVIFSTYLDSIARVPVESANLAPADEPVWTVWRTNPTVGWLMSGEWHQDVPPLKEHYSGGLEEYAETLLRTWTVLTFYWGSAALWPRCKVPSQKNGEAGCCDEPLLCHQGHGRHGMCAETISRSGVVTNCEGEAVWACHRHYRSAVCQRCLGKLQAVRCGAGPSRAGAGPTGASTDIYNAVVLREESRTIGTVFHLADVTSRKPPQKPPNWRTTYRLQPSALVAVVKLSAINEPLQAAHVLHWAEIVQSTGPAKGVPVHESRFRQDGKMTIRLLGRGDIATFTNEPDLPLNTQVAIIDLKVFVPEVISVLATFANPRFGEHLSLIPFAKRLIGVEPSPPLIRLPALNAMIAGYTIKAIKESEIRCLQMLSEEYKHAIVIEILALPPVKNLYGTQLEAFANGLGSALHCTQGPPGTGKSYVGVCIILALVIVRKYVLKNGNSVGPILMLSYKNHALEEFLTDVLKFAPWLRPGQLVRCGKVEHPELLEFSEFNSKDERQAEVALQQCIRTQRAARATSKSWLELARSLEFTSPVAENSVLRVMELLVRLAAPCLVDADAGEQALFDALVDEDALIPSLICAESPPVTAFDVYAEVFYEWVDQVDHWKEVVNRRNAAQQVQLLLTRWLRGEVPPPRCQWDGGDGDHYGCDRYCVKDQSFCRAHLCRIAGCSFPRWDDEAGQAVHCEFHICKAEDCISVRLAAGSFCTDHSCVGCVAQVMAGNVDVEVEMVLQAGSGCSEHCCQYANCLQTKLSPHSYCIDHICLCCAQDPLPYNAWLSRHPGGFCDSHECLVDGCSEQRLLSIDDAEYCAYHTCRLCTDAVDLSSGEAALSMLCADHRCAYPEYTCQQEVLETNDVLTERCAFHTCHVCVTDPSAAEWGDITEDFPRNVCEAHPLCICPLVPENADIILCGECAVPGGDFCAEHIVDEKMGEKEAAEAVELVYNGVCHGLTKKGANCKTKCPEPQQMYCSAHVNQAFEADNHGTARARRVPVVPVDRQQVMHAAFEAKLTVYMNDLLQNEATVKREHFAYQTLQCSHDGCSVHTLMARTETPRGGELWRCALHTAVPLPLAPAEPEDVSEEGCNDDIAPAQSVDVPSAGKGPATENLNAKPAAKKAAVGSEDDDYEIVLSDEHFAQTDAVGGHQLDPDEMDVDYFDMAGYDPRRPVSGAKSGTSAPVVGGAGEEEGDDGEGGNDDQRRLQEIGALDEDRQAAEEADETDSVDDPAVDADADIDGLDDDELVLRAMDEAESWNWQWSVSQRHEAVSRLVRLMVKRLNSLRTRYEAVVSEARMTKSEAGAATLKKAVIVGATVVGASKRLEKFRAAEPFAAVVEEACEVMEPTLISVLAVKSLQKLELVGDHRQLPAFVQQCWYNLETTMPSIKTSMFERLIGDVRWKKTGRQIQATPNAVIHRVPFSVLDEQRRMRRNLADLTRPHYSDVTKITDHPKTASQQLGDTLVLRASGSKECRKQLSALQLHQQSWSSLSLDTIPGVTSNVFFWDLPGNAESRPEAGLSACNESEARSVVNISKFLILCGTPPSSITIITPYKGQKNLIIKLLRLEKLLPERSFNNPGHHEDAAPITVSTVDTFQGDENDIILLSLVRCKPGNRFIELQNRFIVAVSRARLALFIVGCRDAVVKGYNQDSKGPAHWVGFVEHLETGGTNTGAGGGEMVPAAAASRIGPGFPICCPRHTSSVWSIRDSKTFPTDANWGSFCRQVCTTKLPCTHKCGMLCHSPSLQPHTPKCTKPVPRPCETHREVILYCGDIKRNTPDEPQEQALRRFACEVRVEHRRPCGHVVPMTCDSQSKITQGTHALPDCTVIVDDFVRPCGHRIAKPTCTDRARYQTEGPPPCNVQVQHTRRGCQCTFGMKCHESVAELNSNRIVVCAHNKEIRRPRCGHALSSFCHTVTPLAANWLQSNSGESVQHAPSATQLLIVPYSDRYGMSEKELASILPECNVKVSYLARCGHSVPNMLCCQAFTTARTNELHLPACMSSKATRCVLCDTPAINVPCRSDAESRRLARMLSLQTLICGYDDQHNTVEEGEIERFSRQEDISVAMVNVWKNLCVSSVRVVRRCGHVLDLKCHDVFRFLSQKRTPGQLVIDPCVEMIDRTLSCSHKVRVKCCDKIKPEPRCTQRNTTPFTFPCGEHAVTPKSCAELRAMEVAKAHGESKCKTEVKVPLYRCGHLVHVECHLSEDVQREAIGKWLVADAIIMPNQHYCAPCRVPDVKCAAGVTVRFPCGHDHTNVPCDEAFAWVADDFATAPNCCERVIIVHPVCGHALEVMCWAAKELQAWNAWPTGVPEVIAQQVLDPTGRAVQQNIVASGIAKPAALPAGITAQMLRCTHHTTYLRETCDHTEIVPCSDAFWHNVAPCRDPIDRYCADCQHRRVIMCHQKDHNEPCQNKVPKLCSTCKVNDVSIECCKSDIQCARQVKADLWCGHEVTWMCGKEFDPRTRGVKAVDFCLPCVAPKWVDYIEENIPAHDVSLHEDCWRPLRDQVEAKVGSFVKILNSRVLVSEPQFHVDARTRIARSVLDALQTRIPGVELPPSAIFLSAEELKSAAYTWVLCRAQGTDQATMETFRTPAATKFGQGVELEILTEAAVQDLFRAKAGAEGDSVDVCVGVVYSRKYLPTSDPFVAGSGKKDIINAQQVMLTRRTSDLYDAVEYTPRAAANTAAGRKYLITWEAGAAVPLAVLTVQQKCECKVCLDSYSTSEGFACPLKCGTFTCWDCLLQSYEMASQAGAIQGQSSTAGELFCSDIKCKCPIKVADLARSNATAAVLERQEKFKIDATVVREVETQLAAQEQRIRDEYARIEQIKDLDEKAAAKLRLKIVDEILCLKCPRCKFAFVDFTGCFALTCGNRNCQCGFCAWCLEDCGDDAHTHVARCPEGTGDVFSTREAFERHHKQKKTIATRNLIQRSDLNKNAIVKLREILRTDLTDLGISLNDVMPAQAAPQAAGAPPPPAQQGFFARWL